MTIAHVDGSGTAPAKSTLTCSTELRLPVLVKPSELKVSLFMVETRMKFSPQQVTVCIAPEVMGVGEVNVRVSVAGTLTSSSSLVNAEAVPDAVMVRSLNVVAKA